MDLANWALRNSPQGLNISSIRVFDHIRNPEIPITLRLHVECRNTDALLLVMFLNFNNKIIKTIMKGSKVLNRTLNDGNHELS